MAQLVLSVVAFIVAIGILVSVHEFGHFWVARKLGFRVLRFSVGFGKPLVRWYGNPFKVLRYWLSYLSPQFASSHVQKDDPTDSQVTEYWLSAIPLGGYVKMAGMIDESMDGTIQNKPYELMSKPVWAQIWVMSAGVIMNILLAFIIFAGVAWDQGIPVPNDDPVIHSLSNDMPAKNMGLLPGDKILSVDDIQISTWTELSTTIHAMPNTPITLTYQRDGVEYEQSITTSFQIQPINGKLDTLGAIGIAPEFTYRPNGFLKATQIGAISTVGGLGLVVLSIK